MFSGAGPGRERGGGGGRAVFLSFDLCWDKKSRLKGQGKQLQGSYCLNSMPNKLILGIWNDPFMGISTSLGIVQADFMGHCSGLKGQLFWGRGRQCWSPSQHPCLRTQKCKGGGRGHCGLV